MSAAGPESPAIHAHRLIGDGRSAALLRPTGEIDWWCAPDLDSPPLLWTLLDPDGAAARWLDVRVHDYSDLPAGSGARTTLLSCRGRIECLDGLIRRPDGAPALVRLVRGLDDDLELTHELALGGFDRAWAEWDGVRPVHGLIAGEPVYVSGGSPEVSGRWLCSLLQAPRGEWSGLCISLDPELGGGPEDWRAEIERNLADDDEFVNLARLPSIGRRRCAEALRVLRQTTYTATGAVAAAVTTSLPEAPGHDRNFDYRYTWLRDASLAVAVAAQLGRADLAERYLKFVIQSTTNRGAPSGPMTDLRGDGVAEERTISDVRGWAGSQPVRVGNGARDQHQYDALGFLLEAVWAYLQQGAALKRPVWALVREIADGLAADGLERETSGIWELRTPRDLVSADIGVWLALDRAVRIARLQRPWHRTHHWRDAREVARNRVLDAVRADGSLPQAYDDVDGATRSDASALLAVIYGLIDRGDVRAARLVDATVAALSAGPLIYRYEPGGDDGFTGVEGAFVPASWWVVSALAVIGRVDEAKARADRLDRALPDLLPEEIDPLTGAGLGNIPLVWSHMEAARAMYLLDDAGLRKDVGRSALWLRHAKHFLEKRRRSKA